MSYQECALYGNLVRYLRDRCAERLAELDPASDAEAARAWLDDLIRGWFFTPQHDLHGDAPRDVIWREQKEEPNVVPPDRMYDLFFDDCPVCQATRDDPGEWHWHYDDGGFPLIVEYDPEGWDERWEAEHEAFERWRAEQGESERWEAEEFRDEEGNLRFVYGFPDATPEQEAHIRAMWGLPTTEEEEAAEPSEIPAYDPPPVPSQEISPAELWLRAAEEPWLDRELHDAARALAGRLGFSVPNPPLTLQCVDLGWHRLTFTEALPLVAGLHDRGVDISAFLEQVRAFPYQDISLEWLITPERCMATMTGVLESDAVEGDPVSAARLRHDRAFIERVSRLIPLHARIWLRGWSDALIHAAFAQAVGWDDELPF
jgi:hypothetical protein